MPVGFDINNEAISTYNRINQSNQIMVLFGFLNKENASRYLYLNRICDLKLQKQSLKLFNKIIYILFDFIM